MACRRPTSAMIIGDTCSDTAVVAFSLSNRSIALATWPLRHRRGVPQAAETIMDQLLDADVPSHVRAFTKNNVSDLSGKVYIVTSSNMGVDKEVAQILFRKSQC